jgi:hypothetical protein
MIMTVEFRKSYTAKVPMRSLKAILAPTSIVKMKCSPVQNILMYHVAPLEYADLGMNRERFKPNLCHFMLLSNQMSEFQPRDRLVTSGIYLSPIPLL